MGRSCVISSIFTFHFGVAGWLVRLAAVLNAHRQRLTWHSADMFRAGVDSCAAHIINLAAFEPRLPRCTHTQFKHTSPLNLRILLLTVELHFARFHLRLVGVCAVFSVSKSTPAVRSKQTTRVPLSWPDARNVCN